MSLYDYELVRLNGDIKAYVRIQNDYTGQITEGIRNIFLKCNKRYFRADGQEVNVTSKYEEFRIKEGKIRDALKWYNETKF